MRITALASGSSGNSFLIQAEGSSLLVDCGLSGRQILERVEKAGEDPSTIKGILVSHGHLDHIKGVGVVSRKLKIPVYMNAGTRRVSERTVGKAHSMEIFETGRIFHLGGFTIHPFSVPHDCADPVGFRIKNGWATVGLATDLGSSTGLVANVLTGVHALVLESNHDPRMLMDGPYPWELKQRVKGRLGHLSNEAGAQLLRQVCSDQLRYVVLAHVSETNNTPDLALASARAAVPQFLETDGEILCAAQDEVGPTIVV
ncbi:MAG: MBL fold metallo-hydrolase [Pseudomonadota bacterium]